MAFICYKERKFHFKTREVIEQAAAICADYAAQGYDLTLRQLYYQFVSLNLITNTEQSYKRLGSIINDGRMAGLLDWDWLVDRGREIDRRSSWGHPRDIIETAADQFHLDWWNDQPVHIEVWVEKRALAGVIERACRALDVTSLACVGYISQSTQHEGAMRLLRKIKDGKRVHIIHLGDHDPSGIDMSRDNEERLRGFIGHHLDDEFGYGDVYDDGTFDWESLSYHMGREDDLFTFERIALNMNQVQAYNPPPNPAKMTDSRVGNYIGLYGRQSWELDALPPQVLSDLVTDRITELVDIDLFEARQEREDAYKLRIADLLRRHGDVLDEVAS